MKLAAICMLFMLASQVQAAGPIYRCGNEYSQVPCPGGKVLESSDPRSAAQRAEAKRVATEDRRRAKAMERERLAQEKAAKPALAGGIKSPPADETASSVKRGNNLRLRGTKAKAAGEEDFVAVEPAKPKPKKPPKPAP